MADAYKDITLNMVLTYHWFDEMVAGRKDVEYRAMTPHWKRLIWDRRERLLDARFSRGYTKTTITRPILEIDIGPCPYEGWEENYYRIHMGAWEMTPQESRMAFHYDHIMAMLRALRIGYVRRVQKKQLKPERRHLVLRLAMLAKRSLEKVQTEDDLERIEEHLERTLKVLRR